MKEYVQYIKGLKPGIRVYNAFRPGGGWGHDPERLKEIGLDYVYAAPFEFDKSRRQLYDALDRLGPIESVVVGCDVRSETIQNYPIWIKTPEIIEEYVGWLDEYPGNNIQGLVFYNEAAVSDENRKAVYEQIRRFA